MNLARRMSGAISGPLPGESMTHAEIIQGLYQGLLGRAADPSGLQSYVEALKRGMPLQAVISAIVESEEFAALHPSLPSIAHELPDLTALHPAKYARRSDGSTVLHAKTDADLRHVEQLIAQHRYYDSFGVWSPKIDADKRVTAALVQGLGARSCLELGCFNGPVLSLLAERGLDVWGVDVSHLACLLAFPNLHQRIRFGNLLELEFDRQFDVFLAMDILEHLSPLDLDSHIERIRQLLARDGYAYINSPMFGADDVFGVAATPYLSEWRVAGEDACWRHMHCDAKGWPMHGHLVWASPKWWEAQFLRHHLVRDRALERTVHEALQGFFSKFAPSRRSFFILRHSDFTPDRAAVSRQLKAAIAPEVAQLPR